MYFWSVSLVYQLSGQFLIFLVDHKNNLVDKKNIWDTKKKFGIPKRNLVNQKKNLVDQKTIWYTKKNLVHQNQETDQKYMDAANFYELKSLDRKSW